MLTAQQISHFETFGFLELRQLFPADEIAAFIDEADGLMGALEGRRSGPSHHAISPFLECGEALAYLPEDDRIYGPIGKLLGPGFVWGGSEGVSGSFNETNDHEWHSDRGGQIDLQYRRIKIMIYLQPMRKEAGALRLIPGSHHAPFHRRLMQLQTQGRSHEIFAVDGCDLSCFPVEVAPGDVVMFDHYLFHAVFGKQEVRRYIALKYAARPETEEQYEALRPHGQDASELHDSFRHSERPRVQAMVEKLLYWEARLG
jgi:hypothetical protein